MIKLIKNIIAIFVILLAMLGAYLLPAVIEAIRQTKKYD